MIPIMQKRVRAIGCARASATVALALCGAMTCRAAPKPAISISCLPTGDGYLRARVAGAIDANIDWPNSGTWCAGEPKSKPDGVRVSFRRAGGVRPRLLFIFGLTGVRPGKPLREGRANLTVIDEGTGRVYGTLGDRRCTIDSLSQRRLAAPHRYRVEAHGFCTQPARAVRGTGDILVSRFDFAGEVNYANP